MIEFRYKREDSDNWIYLRVSCTLRDEIVDFLQGLDSSFRWQWTIMFGTPTDFKYITTKMLHKRNNEGRGQNIISHTSQ